MYPVAIMLCFNVIMMSLMTIFGPIKYEMKDTKYDRFGQTIEQYGLCTYDDALPFFIPTVVLNLGIVGLALSQAWRARHLSTEFAESKYIANALLIIILVVIFAIPVLILAQNDPNIDTFINIIIASVLTGNPLCFIFI